jgi:hypothetical protein
MIAFLANYRLIDCLLDKVGSGASYFLSTKGKAGPPLNSFLADAINLLGNVRDSTTFIKVHHC